MEKIEISRDELRELQNLSNEVEAGGAYKKNEFGETNAKSLSKLIQEICYRNK